MASNIRVVLEVDNKKYIADIKAADSATKQFASNAEINTAKISSAFSRLTGGLDVINRRIGGLRTAIAGAGFAALGRSSLEMADAIGDLSAASGIAIGQLYEFKNALAAAGGQADQMPTAINTLLRSIDEAAGGSIRAQNSFMDLGISLRELGALSERDLLIKTLEGIAAIESPTRRATEMMDKFGKSFKTVDPQELLDKLRATAGEGDKYAASIQRAAKLNDDLAAAQAKLKLAFLEAFSPIIEQVNKFTDATDEGSKKLEGLIVAVKAVGIALAASFAVTAGLGIVTLIGQIGRGLMSIAKLAGIAGSVGIFAATGPWMVALRGIVVLIATVGTAIVGATTLFDDFGDVAVNALARVVEGLGELAAGILNLPTDALASFLNLLPGVNIQNAMGLGTPFKIATEEAKKARLAAEELAKKTRDAAKARSDFAKTDPRRGTGDTGPTGRDVDTSARENAIKQLQQIGVELSKNLAKRREQIGVDTQAIGLSDQEKEKLSAANEVRNQISDSIDRLIEKRQTLNKEEKYLIPTIDAEIKKLQERAEIEVGSIVAAIDAKQKKAAQDRINLSMLKQEVDLENLRAQVLGYSLSEQEKFNQARKGEDFRSKTKEEVDLLEQQAIARDKLISTLNIEKTARELNATLLELESSILGRQYSAVEKLNQAKLASPEAFARRTQAEITALEEQAKKIDEVTANFKAMAFARDLMRQGEDYAQNLKDQMNLETAVGEAARRRIQVEIEGRDQLRTKLREINDAYGEESKLTDEMKAKRSAEIASAVAGIDQLIAKKQESVQQDQAIRDTFQFGWETAFGKYAEDAQNAANQAQTYFSTFTRGFEDAIVKFVQTGKLSFKDLANSIIADFARIMAKKALMGLFGMGGGGGGGLLGSLFGGFFAAGGNPPIGKASIVGENGPELFVPRNAGTIIPNSQIGGQGNQTYVTYNIQATDAASFKQMVAQDPKFLHAVVEKGRRSLPQGAMR